MKWLVAVFSSAQVYKKVSFSLMINDAGELLTRLIITHQNLESIIPLNWKLLHIIACGKINLTIQF